MTMTPDSELLQRVAKRIIASSMLVGGASRVEIVEDRVSVHGTDVDIVVINGPESRRVKVKADPYFGSDSKKIADRDLSLYRAETGSFAFEALANSMTREPGWTLASDAQDLYYYNVALSQYPEEIMELVSEGDDVFFSELAVDRDELIVLPMPDIRAWFERHYTNYPPRPVLHDDAAAWYRLVPREDVESAVKGVRSMGSIFGALRR